MNSILLLIKEVLSIKMIFSRKISQNFTQKAQKINYIQFSALFCDLSVLICEKLKLKTF